VPARFAPTLGANLRRITAEIAGAPAGAEGVIFTQGGRRGGITLFAKGGRVVLELAPVSTHPAAAAHTRIVARDPLPPGRSEMVITLAPKSASAPSPQTADTAVQTANALNRSYDVTLALNGKVIGREDFESGQFISTFFGGNARNPLGLAVSIGGNPSAPVSRDPAAGRPFNGVIDSVTFSAE
jgi:hypothetical protein